MIEVIVAVIIGYCLLLGLGAIAGAIQNNKEGDEIKDAVHKDEV